MSSRRFGHGRVGCDFCIHPHGSKHECPGPNVADIAQGTMFAGIFWCVVIFICLNIVIAAGSHQIGLF